MVAEHLQPVGMPRTCQKLRRAFADPFAMLAAQEAAMIEEELKQGQIARSQVATEKEVAPQPAVEIFDNRTGTYRALGQTFDVLAHRVISGTQFLVQHGISLPALRQARV